jgi:hypothetical protein
MKTVPFFLLLAFLALSIQGCIQEKVEIPDEVTGLAPIYFDGDWQVITSKPPQPIESLFKIYYKDDYLFVGEAQKGVHVIDNTDPLNPERIRFIQIIGNSDIAIKGNILYANNLSDLVAINITDLENIEVISRQENVFPQAGGQLPAGYVGFFECPDPNLGPIIGWSETNLESPECWR